jgi:hypothetical protein
MLPEPMGFMPSCPACELAQAVQVTNDWVKHPKIVYCMTTHKYLNTKYYRCLSCVKNFVEYHEDSQRVDSEKLVGIFNYFVTKYYYAVDYDLFNYIVEHAAESPTSVIHRKIQAAVYNTYLDDAAYYYWMCSLQVVKKGKPSSNPVGQ